MQKLEVRTALANVAKAEGCEIASYKCLTHDGKLKAFQ